MSVNRGIYFTFIGVIAQLVELGTENPCAPVRIRMTPQILKIELWQRK